MDSNREAQDSDNVETIDTWVPISSWPLRPFDDIQDSEGPVSSPVIDEGVIDFGEPMHWKGGRMPWSLLYWIIRRFSQWSVVSEEEKRWLLTCWIMCLFSIWFFTGLIVFLVSGNAWLLVGAGLLTWPVAKVLGYYFHRPKK